jgi:beta-N-acetylhexosaminidase
MAYTARAMTRLPLGQLFVVGFDGHDVPDSARNLFVEHGAGGAILFKRNIDSLEQTVAINTQLFEIGQRCAQPLIVSVDQEGGRVARLRGICTDVPAMRTVGKAAETDPELPYRLGAMMARELVALGFHWDFAPVADVDTNPHNPVIGERSFSRDAAVVGRVAARFIEGMQGQGIAACAKHFPGHGDTDTDSHLALPRLSHSLERLRSVELLPFQRACAVGVASVMTAHVMFPALDEHEPATLSQTILEQLLRQELGYDGVCVSDDLEMAAVADRYDVEVLVEKGLNAGCDLFLICHDNDKAARAIEAAHMLVASGKVPLERVQQALRRVQAMKGRYVGAPAAPSLTDARALVRSAPHLALAERLAAVTVDGVERVSSIVDLG